LGLGLGFVLGIRTIDATIAAAMLPVLGLGLGLGLELGSNCKPNPNSSQTYLLAYILMTSPGTKNVPPIFRPEPITHYDRINGPPG
jgi:hypothetical protein